MDSNKEQSDDFSLKVLLEAIKNWLSFLITKSNDIIKFDSDDTDTNHISFKGPTSLSSTVTYTLPEDGSNGQFLKTNGSGTLSFADDSDATALLVIGRSANTSVTVTTGNLTVVGRSANVSVGVS